MSSFVYFIRSESGKIKIGVTTDVRKRLGSLRTSSSERIDLIGYMQGDVSLERSLHQKFAASRLSGEWFSPSSDLLDFIEFSVTDREANVSFRPDVSDRFTVLASEWVSEAMSIYKMQNGYAIPEARDAFALRCGVPAGLIENLMRGRIVAITARDFDKMRVGILSLVEERIANVKKQRDEARDFWVAR